MSDYFDSLAARTPARLQIGRAGSRYKTQKYLDNIFLSKNLNRLSYRFSEVNALISRNKYLFLHFILKVTK